MLKLVLVVIVPTFTVNGDVGAPIETITTVPFVVIDELLQAILPSPVLQVCVVAFQALSVNVIVVLAGISTNATKAILFDASAFAAIIAISPAVNPYIPLISKTSMVNKSNVFFIIPP
jgi:hypothetical protein